jgi:hypothetical protein
MCSEWELNGRIEMTLTMDQSLRGGNDIIKSRRMIGAKIIFLFEKKNNLFSVLKRRVRRTIYHVVLRKYYDYSTCGNYWYWF